MTPITDKIVLITGASSGIGAATAKSLRQSGVKLFLGVRRGDRLAALCEKINTAGGQSDFSALAVRRADEMQEFTQAALPSVSLRLTANGLAEIEVAVPKGRAVGVRYPAAQLAHMDSEQGASA